jgi:hypothetical protein
MFVHDRYKIFVWMESKVKKNYNNITKTSMNGDQLET